MKKSEINTLIDAAKGMMKYSYAPYSGFNVGAALLTDDGRVYTGCNIENAAYGPSVCAERTAIFKAVSEGKRSFRAIAVCGGAGGVIARYCPPCGLCRQVMREFCSDDMPVILIGTAGDYKVVTFGELLPLSFSGENIE